MRGNLFSEEELHLAKELLAQGHSLAFVAEALGRRETSVRRWALRLSLIRSRRPWTQEDKKTCHEMRNRGASAQEIAEALERSSDSVNSMLSALSRRPKPVPPPSPKPAPPPAPPAPRDIYVAWLVAQEKVRRRVDRSVNNA
jgi:hypothetical protein